MDFFLFLYFFCDFVLVDVMFLCSFIHVCVCGGVLRVNMGVFVCVGCGFVFSYGDFKYVLRDDGWH